MPNKKVALIKYNNKDHDFVTWPLKAKGNGLDFLIEFYSGYYSIMEYQSS